MLPRSLKPVWLMTCGCATCVLPTQRAGGTKESPEAQVGLEWGADTPERTVTSKGMGTGLCRVWSVTLMEVPRNPNLEGNWVRSSLCLGDRSFSPCKWRIWLIILVGAWGAPTSLLLSWWVFQRGLSRTCNTFYGRRCLRTAPGSPLRSLYSIEQMIKPCNRVPQLVV